MIKARIIQGLTFIFGKYKEENNLYVKSVLSDKEFEIFQGMSEYDRIHSFRLYKMVSQDTLLKDSKLYKKLALLHDCGKFNASLFRRMKKVLTGDKILDRHSLDSLEKLKDINTELAILARDHHKPSEDVMMIRFQSLDDK